MSNKIKINPCPFCGKNGRLLQVGWNSVVCSNVDCLARGPIKQTVKEAIKAWNSAWQKKE